MKNSIRLLLIASALASLVNSNADHESRATISSFSNSLSSTFNAQQLQEIRWLTLDPEDGENNLTSLSDLSHFPNLQGLYIENASKITDFSPIWQLKDTLEYLEIEERVLVPPIFRACRSCPSFVRWIWTPANLPILIFWEVFRN